MSTNEKTILVSYTSIVVGMVFATVFLRTGIPPVIAETTDEKRSFENTASAPEMPNISLLRNGNQRGWDSAYNYWN